MRRPILLIFSGLSAGILLCHWWGTDMFSLWMKKLELWVLFVFLMLWVGMWLKRSLAQPEKKDWFKLVLLTTVAAISGFCWLLAADAQGMPLQQMAGQTVELQGIIQEVKETEYSVQMVLTHIKGRKVLVSASKSGLSRWEAHWDQLVGRGIRVKGKAELPACRRNPGCFDYRLYLKSKKILLLVRANGRLIISDQVQAPVSHKVAQLRQRFSDGITKRMPEEEAGLFLAMLFGDRSLLEEEIYDSFRKNGISHVLAVSGLHVGLVFSWVNRAMGKRKSLCYALISSGILIFYGALAFFSPSVVRAVIMILLRTGASLLHRRYDMTCSAATAGTIMLAGNPYLLFHSGFQLSFLAIFSLAVLLPRFEMLMGKWAKPLPSKLASPVLTMVAVQGAMTPVTAYLFQYVSWTGLLVNLPVLAMAGLLIPCGILLLLLYGAEGLEPCLGALPLAGGVLQIGMESLFSLAEGMGTAAAELLLKGMILLSRFFSSLKMGGRWVVSPNLGLVLLFLASLFFLSSEGFQILCRKGSFHTAGRVLITVGIASLLLSLCAPQLAGYGLAGNRPQFVFVDVGQGDCLHIRTPKGKNVLIDGGGSIHYEVGKKTLLPYLLKNGVSHIDLAIATHLHQDHFGGLAELSKEIPIEKMGTYRANRLRPEVITEKSGIPAEHIVYLAAGDRIKLEEDAFIEVLYPFPQTDEVYRGMIAEEADENRSSLLLKVTVNGFSILMTGDMGFPGEEDVMKSYEMEEGDRDLQQADGDPSQAHRDLQQAGGNPSKSHRDLQQAYPDPLQVSVLKIGHHGSRYSTGDEFLRRVSPKAAIIQVGKNNFGHPSPGVIVKCRNSGIMLYRNDLQGAIMFTRQKGDQWQADCIIPNTQETTWPIHPKQKGQSIPTKEYKKKSKKKA